MENNIKPANFDERVHPELKENFLKIPKVIKPFEEEKIPLTRKGVTTMFSLRTKYPDDNLKVSTRKIPGPEGAPEVEIKIYKPKEADTNTKLPGLLWIHGGGYLFGNLDSASYWPVCLADQAKCVSIVVDYRLAPEHPYPAGLEDCYATLVWIVKAAEELGIDVDRIAVGGESAGGGLTAALTLLARDRKGPKILFQMPLYPMIDDRSITSSSYEITDERTWNRATNTTAWPMYLKNLQGKEIPIYAAPARAKDLSNLPPAFTFIGDLDVFRDETIDYAQRLLQAGVPVEFHVYPGCTHSFEVAYTGTELAKRVFSTGVYAFKNAVSSQQNKS